MTNNPTIFTLAPSREVPTSALTRLAIELSGTMEPDEAAPFLKAFHGATDYDATAVFHDYLVWLVKDYFWKAAGPNTYTGIAWDYLEATRQGAKVRSWEWHEMLPWIKEESFGAADVATAAMWLPTDPQRAAMAAYAAGECFDAPDFVTQVEKLLELVGTVQAVTA